MTLALWVERLALTNFRSYASASVSTDAGPQVIVGANGSGKTNLLEALSLLSPGQGLRRVPFIDLARASGDGSFAVAAHAHTLTGIADIGTGLQAKISTPTPNPSPQGGGEFSRSSDRNSKRDSERGPNVGVSSASTAARSQARVFSPIISKSSG